MMSNRSLVLVSLLLAIGIVYIKGQERIEERTLINLQVSIDNQAENILLPDTSLLPVVTVTVQGPSNLVGQILPANSLFRIDLEEFPPGTVQDPETIILTGSMLRTNLEAVDRSTIFVDEQSIRPRQVKLIVMPHEMGRPRQLPPESEDDIPVIPLYRVEKVVPVMVSSTNDPEPPYRVRSILVDPPSIRLTGAPDALASIDSLSTIQWDLAGVRPELNTAFLTLTGLADRTDVRPVGGRVLGVSATVILEQGN